MQRRPNFLLACALVISLVPAPGCNATTPVSRQVSAGNAANQKNGFGERELAANASLAVKPNNVVFLSLEPPGGGASGADTGAGGLDLVPIEVDRAATYSVRAGIGQAHAVRLLDNAGNVLLSVPGGGEASRDLTPGRYALELRSGTAPGQPEEPVFLQLGGTAGLTTRQTSAVQGKVSWLLNTNNCGGCDLTQADLTNASLSQANLQDATLYNATFTGADLSSANLSYTDSRRAQFGKANLTKTNFSYANMMGAYLSGATQTGTNFTGVSLTNVIF